jgi:hypothetical protein
MTEPDEPDLTVNTDDEPDPYLEQRDIARGLDDTNLVQQATNPENEGLTAVAFTDEAVLRGLLPPTDE